jgi:excinuclease ABC subunit C
LYDLQKTVKQSARKFARDMPRAHSAQAELEDLAQVLALPKVPRVIEGFDISHIHGQHTVGSMVQFVEGRPSKANYRHFNIRGEKLKKLEAALLQGGPSQNDDYASMREIVGRRYRRLRDEQRPLPDLILIDGGRGQLNSALFVLKEVGVEISVIGLAKDEEEIYLAMEAKPLRLPSSSLALQLLQRIRDESHRFANTLHHAWRKKQIRESILDELSGLGPRRKKALLEHFGSLERLREAPMEEIRKVEGFGVRSAEILWKFLRQQSKVESLAENAAPKGDPQIDAD